MADLIPFTALVAGNLNTTYSPNVVVVSGVGGTVNVNSNIYIDSSGNVGVGTTLPLSKMSVGGNIRISNTADSNSGIYFADGTFQSTASSVYTPLTYTYTGDGVTAIYSTSPSVASNVTFTNVYVGGVYQRKSAYTWTGTSLTFSSAPAIYSPIEINVVQSTSINFSSTNLAVSGVVGVGTASTTGISSGTALAVYGGNIQIGTAGNGVKFPDGTFQNSASSGSSIAVTNDTTTNASTYYPSLTNNVTSGTLSALTTSSTKLFYNPSTGALNAGQFIPSGSTAPTNGMFLPAANTLGWATNSSEKMRINANGNVGIGSTTPTVSLDLSQKTDGILLPAGTTAQRPPAYPNGIIRYNTTTGMPETYSNIYGGWSTIGAAYSSVRQQFTATSGQTTFTVSYAPGQVDVYYNGVKLQAGVEVNTSSGTAVVLAVGATTGALLEVVGLGPSSIVSSNSQVVYQQFTATASQTTFTVTGGYVPGMVDVFVEGIKLVNGTDVNISNGTTVVVSNALVINSIVEVRGVTSPTNPSVTAMVRQSFTATASQTSFTVTGGYIPGAVDVYYNGSKLVNGSDVNTSSGTAVVLASGATVGAAIDVVGINYYTNAGGVTTPVRQSFTATAGQTTFTVTGGYSATFCDVYQNGVKLVNGTDVNVSSGSTVVLATGAAVSDTIDVVAFSAISYQDAVKKSGDTMTGTLNLPAGGLNVGSGQLYADPSGNMGIGTISPGAKLDVNGTARSGYNVIYGTATYVGQSITNLYSAAEGISYIDAHNRSDAADSHIFFGHQTDGGSYITLATQPSGAFTDRRVERMRIDASGNMGIGTTSPGARLQVTDGNFSQLYLLSSTTVSGIRFGNTTYTNGYIYYDNGANLTFQTNGGERARIDSSGNLLVGVTADPANSGNNGVSFYKATNNFEFHSRSGVTTVSYVGVFYNGNGTVGSISTNGSATTYATSSDYRLKNSVAPMTTGLETVAALKPVTYKWNADDSDGEGFIAHELQEVIPHAVTGEKDAVNEDGSIKSQGVDYSKIVVHLVAAIQELSAKNSALEARLAALENK